MGIQKLLPSDDGHIFSIRKKMVNRCTSPFWFSSRRRYLLCVEHIHDLSQTRSCYIEIKNHRDNISFVLVNFEYPVAVLNKTIGNSHVLFLLKTRIPMLLSHSGDKTWEYSIFSMSVLHNLQVHFAARLCQKNKSCV